MSVRQLLTRWIGLTLVGMRRTLSRATRTAQKRVQFTVLGVVVTVALLVIVTGIGIGLVTGATVADDDIDYWIVPETDGDRSPLLATDQPQFGDVHEMNAQISTIDDVTFSTPVLAQVLSVEANGADEYVLVVGIINGPSVDQVTGVSTDGLTPDDPYYGSGTYDGEWTGDVVLSRSAAGLLDAEPGDSVTISDNSSFTVAAVDDETGGVGETPVALVQLSELQTLTGSDAYDQADQFVVGAQSSAVESQLEDLDPESSVYTRGQLLATETTDSDLPLALAVTAFVVAVAVGTLFVLTTNGLEIAADRRQLATMSAIGISVRSQLQLVGVQTVVLTGIGGVVGSLVGMVGIRAANWVAMETITTEPIAISHPLFIAYGTGVALLIGLLSLPYLLVLTRRVTGGVPH
ncbi:ABC transporter permease [Halopiger djelfimassiliensis]|uniref:ABC transporter permease n=1 Tax=Halopiger djelfimassiliensis TaxID=1293047 RepID=UPI00067830DF|nr:ABC transporter permease [Halopiger djelfimassiliensis]